MKKRVIEECIRICINDIEKHPEYGYFPHWTFIIIDNKIVSKGWNRRCEPPIYTGYHDSSRDGFVPKKHAEMDSIDRCWRKLENFEILNVRMNKSRELMRSKPCPVCFKKLKDLNCKEIWYTEDNKILKLA